MIMGKRNIFNQNLILITSLALLFTAFVLNLKSPRPPLNISKQQSSINLNAKILKVGSIGNSRLISSVLWVITLMESDTDHYLKKDLLNWMYLRFHAISELDPRFYENYLWGGILLSISKDDLAGAEKLLDLGLEIFPADYRLNYLAGFNAYFEMGNYEKGLHYFDKIKDHPEAPTGLQFIINKLRYETGQNYETTFEFLKQSYDNSRDENLRNKLLSDLYALKAQRDINCLNEGGHECDRLDLEGNAYKIRNGKWVATKEFRAFRVFRKDKGKD
jgi:tetratricopeptide (TPR) repeat protein